MKKKLLLILCAVLLLCTTPVFATADHAHIYDETDLITSQNENICEALCASIEENYGYCVVFCLIPDTDGLVNVNQYCADIYANRVSAKNAVVCAYDLTKNLYGYYLAGDAQKYFTQETMDALFDLYTSALVPTNGVTAFITEVKRLLDTDFAEPVVVTEPQNVQENNDFFFVIDRADVLTTAQESALNEELSALSDEKNADFVVLTVSSLEGKSSLSFADDYFDYNGYGRGEDRSGMLLLYKTGAAGDRDIALSTRGALYDCVTDKDSDDFLDSIIPDLMDENYEDAFSAFVRFAEEEADEIGKIKTLPWTYIPICLLIGFVVAFIILKIQTSSLKSVRKERDAQYYVRREALVLSASRDRFLYRNVKKIPKQTQSSSSSGTSGRVSSSGARHGGTSKKF
ncbi:MAG: TPM domain-containing protein [Ruminococcaceae bacterium]|nr:TPM domain-containing protein [Oscillospiraceae bacterium]